MSIFFFSSSACAFAVCARLFFGFCEGVWLWSRESFLHTHPDLLSLAVSLSRSLLLSLSLSHFLSISVSLSLSLSPLSVSISLFLSLSSLPPFSDVCV